jgi:hypothetical protein
MRPGLRRCSPRDTMLASQQKLKTLNIHAARPTALRVCSQPGIPRSRPQRKIMEHSTFMRLTRAARCAASQFRSRPSNAKKMRRSNIHAVTGGTARVRPA